MNTTKIFSCTADRQTTPQRLFYWKKIQSSLTVTGLWNSFTIISHRWLATGKRWDFLQSIVISMLHANWANSSTPLYRHSRLPLQRVSIERLTKTTGSYIKGQLQWKMTFVSLMCFQIVDSTKDYMHGTSTKCLIKTCSYFLTRTHWEPARSEYQWH